jgi:hypothetical protein
MPEVWERLDSYYDFPVQFTYELMWEIAVSPKIKDREYKKLLIHYEMLKDNMGEAAKNNQSSLFLIPQYIDKMTEALPPSEEEFWRRAKGRVHQEDLGPVFAAFVQERVEWFTDQACGSRNTASKPTPSPTDATKSGSGGGKHGKGKGTRKNANAVPVQGGNKVRKSARASCYPARIRGSKQASNAAQKPGLTSKPAQERSQDTLSRKRSPEQDAAARSEGGYEYPQGCDPAGPHADRRAEALEIPGSRSQEEQYATGAARIVGVVTSGNDGVSSLAQVTSATTAPKDGTRQSTNNTSSPALAPKKKKKSDVNKRRASPSPGQGEVLQVDDEPDETPRRAYKKPARQQVPDQQGVPARQQVPSQRPRPATSQAPMGKRGRMKCAQRQAAGRAATPFQTTRPPDGQRRDGLTN